MRIWVLRFWEFEDQVQGEIIRREIGGNVFFSQKVELNRDRERKEGEKGI